MTTAAAAAVVSNGSSPASTTATGGTTTTTTGAHTRAHSVAYWSRHVRSYRRGTRRWITVIRGRPPRSAVRTLSARSPRRLPQLARAWRHREHAVWWRAIHPPRLHAWLCIHHYEGSWTDPGGPYWGGLQMNFSFQATYGGWLLRHKGTADHWSPLEQIWVAVRASHTRGFSPWPNTAHYCGML
jgi:hypothetical protein